MKCGMNVFSLIGWSLESLFNAYKTVDRISLAGYKIISECWEASSWRRDDELLNTWADHTRISIRHLVLLQARSQSLIIFVYELAQVKSAATSKVKFLLNGSQHKKIKCCCRSLMQMMQRKASGRIVFPGIKIDIQPAISVCKFISAHLSLQLMSLEGAQAIAMIRRAIIRHKVRGGARKLVSITPCTRLSDNWISQKCVLWICSNALQFAESRKLWINFYCFTAANSHIIYN